MTLFQKKNKLRPIDQLGAEKIAEFQKLFSINIMKYIVTFGINLLIKCFSSINRINR